MYLSFAETEVNTVPDLLDILLKYPYDRQSGRIIDPPHVQISRDYNANTVVNSYPQPNSPPREICPPTVSITPHSVSELSTPGCNLYALLIGIDSYKTKPLRGSINDAIAVKEYLVRDLGVSDKQIQMLLNEQASRSGILQAFTDLRMDARIKKGDPILIFYAGHGTEIDSPQGWEAGHTKIQAIIPHDFSEDAPVVHCIPDRTLGTMIDILAKEKGDNITVVFDSCHSGSGTRDDDGGVRSMKIVDVLPANIDSEIIGSGDPTLLLSREGNASADFEHKGLRSHMLIAACSHFESAKECYIDLDKITRGQFTVALLALFRREGVDKLTYNDICSRLDPMTGQNPQLEGNNRHRLLFNLQGPASGIPHYDLGIQDGKFTLDIGMIHGLSKGAQFKFYRDHASFLSGPQLGVLEIAEDSDIKVDSTILSPLSQSVDLAVSKGIAVQTRAGERVDLYIHVRFELDELPIFDALVKHMKATELSPEPSPSRYRIVHTDVKGEAHLAFEVKDNVVVAEIVDVRARAHGLIRIPYPIEAKVNHIHSFLDHAAHFYRHLSSEPKNTYIPSKITFEFMELIQTDDFDDDGYPLMGATGPNIIKNDIINIVADRNKRYGMRVTNNTPWDLYPYAFLFSNSTLQISPYYMSPYGGKYYVDPPLTSGNTLTIGYGASGGVPYSFTLGDAQDIDVEFFKFFFLTQPTDMSSIKQDSPFGRGMGPKSTRVQNIYGVKVIPVVERRF